jgi:hypothetical protein
MNLPGIDDKTLAAAQGRLESWFDSMHGPAGYYGPVVGFRGVGAGYCGPGFDWRYEGLLEGWMAMGRACPEATLAGRIEGALAEIRRSRLANGTLRCSYFESNPFDGGMPHEPILMSSALRARSFLHSVGRPFDPAFDSLLERFVRERLVKELWNKALKTFNNWIQSEYESYSPAAVASIVEVLVGYQEIAGDGSVLDSMIQGAAESLLAVQIRTGPLAGGIPVSNRSGVPINPYLAARCLTALTLLHRKLNDDRFSQAGEALSNFLGRISLKQGGFPLQVGPGGAARETPVFVGATAGVLVELARSGRLTEPVLQPHLAFILGRQTVSGAFHTAVGFNGGGGASRPDWRDVMPVCGWGDKIYHLLALLRPGAVTPVPTGEVRCDVMVRGKPAEFEETQRGMRLTCHPEKTCFAWEKGRKWPQICTL